MTEVIQKSISSISDLLYDHLGFSVTDGGNNGERISRFIKCFSMLRFKHDEQVLAKVEIEKSKLTLNQLSITQAKKYSELIALSFLHNVGYDVSFSFIHAVNMAQQGDPMSKRLGYLLCSLFFDENHQLALLLINTILKDLQNKNVANECAALVATTQLVAVGDLPTVLPYVKRHLGHRVPVARKKVLQCLYACLHRDPSLASQVVPLLAGCLGDSDPGVVWAAVEIYLLVAERDPASYRFLVAPVLNLVEKIGGLAGAYAYQGSPSPWFLMSLVRLLVLLSRGCQRSTDATSAALLKLLEQTKASHRIGFAILFEVVKAVCELDCTPSEGVVEASCDCIRRFLSAASFCLKLSGVRLLAMLIPKRPSSVALGFQSAILDVVGCSDPSLRRAALDLLFVMANKSNKSFVCQKILEEVDRMENFDDDPSLNSKSREEIHRRLVDLICRFSRDDPVWFVVFVFHVLERIDRNASRVNFDRNFMMDLLRGTEENISLARQKAIQLSVEKWKEIHRNPSKIEESTGVALVSLQVLANFFSPSEPDFDDTIGVLASLLPNVSPDPRLLQLVSSVVLIFIDEVSVETRKRIADALDVLLPDCLHHLGTIDAAGRLNLIELKVLSSREAVCSPLHLTSGYKVLEDDDDLHIGLDSYVVDHLEAGGRPYTRPGVVPSEVPRLSTRQTTRRSDEEGGEWGGDSSFKDVTQLLEASWSANDESLDSSKRELKFSSEGLGSSWSKAGYTGATSQARVNQDRRQAIARVVEGGHEKAKEEEEDDDDCNPYNQLFRGF